MNAALAECTQETLASIGTLSLNDGLIRLHRRISNSLDLGRAAEPFLNKLRAAIDEVVASGADPFDDLFATTLEITQLAYATYGVIDPVAAGTLLSTVHFAIDVHRMRPCPQVSGKKPSGINQVELRVKGEELTRDGYRAIPYLLLHELVSHCAQGPGSEAGAPSAEKDAFAEGWMDRVALEIHNQVMLGYGPARRLRARLDDHLAT